MEVLSWDEPRSYRRSENLRGLKILGPETFKSFFIVTGGLLLLRGLVALNPNPKNNPIGWGPMLGLAIGVGVIASFVGPWLIASLGFARVLLSNKGVNHNSLKGFAWRIDHYPWSTIESALIGVEGDQRIQSVQMANGKKAKFAVAPRISDAEINAFIRQYQASKIGGSAK